MVFKGIPASAGYAVGPVFLYVPFSPRAEESAFPPGEEPANRELYADAMRRASEELQELTRTIPSPDKAAIFSAHQEILADEAIHEAILEAICGERQTPEVAVYNIYTAYAQQIGRSKNALIRERAADLIDVRNRLIRCLRGLPERNLSLLATPCVVVAHDLLPSDAAVLDREKVLGLVTETGGSTSHAAILARSYEIPAVLGCAGIAVSLRDGDVIALDAVKGEIYAPADEKTCGVTAALRRKYEAQRGEMKAWDARPAATSDGVRMDILLNVGSAALPENAANADGIGLLRSEFLYMESDHLPTEEEQTSVYAGVLSAMKPRPVTLRTLDIGGDKTLSYRKLPEESNPFLGCRALRLCLAERELFAAQLRAALRASVSGELWIMFPMVASVEDWRAAKACLEEAKAELLEKGVPVSDSIRLGIMIETPSAALCARELAAEADFASIGTNDLIQYLFAADRMNPNVAEYARGYSPVVFRVIRDVISAFQDAGKPVSVCGEMGGDLMAVPVLAGCGLRKFSMSASKTAAVKKLLSASGTEEMRRLAARVTALTDQAQAIEEIQQFLREKGALPL